MDRRLVISALITMAMTPVIAGGVAVSLIWCLHQWDTPLWLLAVIGVGLFAAFTYGSWRVARRLTERRLAFSMRSMLLAFAIIAVLFGTIGRWFFETYRQHQAIRTVSERGGGVLRYDVSAADSRDWLYRWIGYDPFAGVQYLEIASDQALAAAIENADQFPDVEVLSFSGGFTAAGLKQSGDFDRFAKLRVGEFMESSIDGEALQHLTQWTNHRELFFNGCPNISDSSLRHLVGLPKLESLSLVEEGGGLAISDSGLAHVGRMENLKSLMLIGLPQVTDGGLTHLERLSKLERLVLRRTAVTAQGLTKLYAALPDCCISADVYVPGRANVQQIIVRRIGEPHSAPSVVTDPDRIGKVLALLHSFRESGQVIGDRDSDHPLPGTVSLEFIGKSRVFYTVRLGNGALQRTHFTRWGWIKWRLPDKENLQFQELLTPIHAE